MVVWKVMDTAEAKFNVDDYTDFVQIQSEAALRNLATHFPYVNYDEGEMALSSHTAEISDQLKVQIQERLEKAGVKVLEARISHLAYSPEIAAAMLQRQQASAVVAARQTIVDGAVGMVESALDALNQRRVIHLDVVDVGKMGGQVPQGGFAFLTVCGECSSSLPDGARFCPGCGSAQP